jgi:biotin carboxyl carrier protein
VERLDEPHPVYAGRAGRLETFLVADGSFVEYGQAVAVLRPAADA